MIATKALAQSSDSRREFSQHKIQSPASTHTAPVPGSNEDVVTPQEISRKRALTQPDAPIDSSAANRKQKLFLLGIEAGGSPWPSAGVHLGIYFTPQLVAEAGVNAGQFYSLPDKKKTWQTELYFVRGKFFWGNSFYTNVGVAGRVVKETTIYANRGQDNEASYATLQASGGALVEAGNRWHWGTFFVGLDWVGLYLPFALFWRDFTPTELTPEENALLKKNFRRRAPDFAPQYLKLNLGISL